MTVGSVLRCGAMLALLLQLVPSSALARDESIGIADQLAARADRKHPKLSSALVGLVETQRTAGDVGAVLEGHARGLAVTPMNVQVEILASGDRGRAEAAVAGVGGIVLAASEDLVDATVPIAALDRLADEGAIRYVRAPLYIKDHAITDEGVASTNARAWHAANLTGAGVKIAIIDSGFSGYKQRQTSGDLPASVVTKDLCRGLATNRNKHGTGVAEIVHKMAPRAQLYLVCHAGTSASIANAADYAISVGAHIINLSAGNVGTARGDGQGGAGTLDAVVAKARANGILWVNSSGNFGAGHWMGQLAPDASGQHRFPRGDHYNNVTIPARARACFAMRWDSWPFTNIDYDLILVRGNTSRIVAAAEDYQGGTQAPVEELCYTNPGSAASFGLAILDTSEAVSASRPRIDLFTDLSLEHAVAAGSVVDPAASPDALAVGATCWNQSTIAKYSSQGPTVDGRVKPDLVGPATVSTATYGRFRSCTATSGFSGTSASAPHVAGAAALVKQANPTFTAAELQAYLEGRATDVGTLGKDSVFGSGKLWLGAPGTPQPTPTPTPTASRTPAAALLAAILLEPAAGAVLPNGHRPGEVCSSGSQWTFRWRLAPGSVSTTRYRLYVTGPNAIDPLIDLDVFGATSYVFRMCGGYVADGNLVGWTWRVAAVSASGTLGPWSEQRSFNVAPLPQ